MFKFKFWNFTIEIFVRRVQSRTRGSQKRVSQMPFNLKNEIDGYLEKKQRES